MITGLNHITLAVSDLDTSVSFYVNVLDAQLKSRHSRGAYLTVGHLWLCLSLDESVLPQPRQDYTHIAFSIASEDFDAFLSRVTRLKIPVWKENQSEGSSVYFLDPDGHKLEVHVGTLATRLDAMRNSSVRATKASGCTT